MEKSKKRNYFYEFVSAIEAGNRLCVQSEDTFRMYNEDKEVSGQESIEVWHVHDDRCERWGRMLHFAEDIVGGALMLRGLALSAPKLYDEDGIEFRMPLYILDEVNVDENREYLEAIESIKFTVVKWKE